MAKLTSTDIYGSLYTQGSILSDISVSSKTIISTIATGTAPLTVASSTLVNNLNVEFLNGQPGSFYMPASTTTFNEVTITNDDLAGVPLTVSGLNGTTVPLQYWKTNGLAVAFLNASGTLYVPNVANTTTSANALIALNTTGTTISRNVADANASLIVNQINAGSTGDILVLQKEGSTLARISGSGQIFGTQFYDYNNSNYYLDPSGTGTSLNVAGDISIPGGKKLIMYNSRNYLAYNTWAADTAAMAIQNANAAGSITLKTNSLSRLFIKSDGNIGLGTDTPITKLETLGVQNTFGSIVSTQLDAGGFTGFGIRGYNAGTGSIKAGFVKERTGNYGLGKIHILNNITSSDANATLADAVITINETNNVGIGDATPSFKLDVTGDINTTGVYRISDSTILQGSSAVTLGSAGATGSIAFNTTSGTGMILKGASVGIGTNDPLGKLTVLSNGILPTLGSDDVNILGNSTVTASRGNLFISSTDALGIDKGGQISFGTVYDASGSNTHMAGIAGRKENASLSDYSGYLQFSTRANSGANTEKMRIASSGNVGIGTSNPGSLLSLQAGGEASLSISTNLAAADASVFLGESVDALTNATKLYYSGADNRFSIATGTSTLSDRFTVLRDTGYVGIGTINPGYNLEVNNTHPTLAVISANEGIATLRLHTSTNEGVYFQNDDGAANKFFIRNANGNGDILTIDYITGNNIGIGTPSPAEKLEVYGNTKSQDFIISDTSNVAQATMKYDSISKSVKFAFA